MRRTLPHPCRLPERRTPPAPCRSPRAVPPSHLPPSTRACPPVGRADARGACRQAPGRGRNREPPGRRRPDRGRARDAEQPTSLAAGIALDEGIGRLGGLRPATRTETTSLARLLDPRPAPALTWYRVAPVSYTHL